MTPDDIVSDMLAIAKGGGALTRFTPWGDPGCQNANHLGRLEHTPNEGLGPNQIAWCREHIPLFAAMQDRRAK